MKFEELATEVAESACARLDEGAEVFDVADALLITAATMVRTAVGPVGAAAWLRNLADHIEELGNGGR